MTTNKPDSNDFILGVTNNKISEESDKLINQFKNTEPQTKNNVNNYVNNYVNNSANTGNRNNSANTGNRNNSANTGNRNNSANTGNRNNSENAGSNRNNSANTGNRNNSANTGNRNNPGNTRSNNVGLNNKVENSLNTKQSNILINHIKRLEDSINSGTNPNQNNLIEQINKGQDINVKGYNITNNGIEPKKQVKGMKLLINEIINKLEKEVVNLNNKIKTYNSEKETISKMSKMEINNLKSIIKKLYKLILDITKSYDPTENGVTKENKIKLLESIRMNISSNKGFLKTIDEIMMNNGSKNIIEKNNSILKKITISNISQNNLSNNRNNNSSQNMGKVFENSGIKTVSNKIELELSNPELFNKNKNSNENSNLFISSIENNQNSINTQRSVNNRVNNSVNNTSSNTVNNAVNNTSSNSVNNNKNKNLFSVNENNNQGYTNNNQSATQLSTPEKSRKYEKLVKKIHEKVVNENNAKKKLNEYFL
jgi:hypothetical protein